MLRLPERIHKRPFVVSSIVALTLIVFSVAIIFLLGIFGPGSNILKVHVYSSYTGSYTGLLVDGAGIEGAGINLPYIPTANLLKNPSFEDKQFDQVYTVYGGTENSVYVEPESGTDTKIENGFFVGGSVRIMSLDEEGRLVPKMQGTVTDFRMNQLGLWTPLTVPSGASQGQKITSLSSSSNISVAVGDKGLLISDVTSSDPVIMDLGTSENFVSSSCVSDRFYAVTKTGSFVTSADGKTWSAFTPEEGKSYSIRTVSSIGKIGIAGGDAGAILICSNGKVTSIPAITSQSLTASASNGSSLILAGMNGELITSSNGVIFRELTQSELPSFSSAPNWQCADFRNGSYILGGDHGEIAIGSFSEDTGLFAFSSHHANDETGLPLSVESVIILSSGEIVIMDAKGSLYCSGDNGISWNNLSIDSMTTIDEIGQTSTGKILLSQGITSQTTQLYTRIQFDEVQSENIFLPGDMCYLQNFTPSLSEAATADSKDFWQGMGEGTSLLIQDFSPSGSGRSSLQVMGAPDQSQDQAHFASQVIKSSAGSPFQKNSLYQIKVWLRQEGIADGEVMAWISGKFDSIGTTFTDVGSSWRQYTYTFLIPEEAQGESPGEIRFNIGFEGQGTLDVDKVYFGLENNADSSIPASFEEPLIAASPSLIRLDNIGFGRMGVSSRAWLLSSGNEGLDKEGGDYLAAGGSSLDASLALVRKAGADPWLVIGSSASQETIDNLMSYLCGSISDPYGMLRIENGTAVPWSMQFSRLVIEISDSNDIFSTDLQRGAYVNYVIGLIQSSPYYVDIKDKFVFLDAMPYDGGTMLSKADYHAGSLTVNNLLQTTAGFEIQTFEEAVTSGYASYFDSIPRTPSRPQQDADEWIRSSVISLFQLQEETAQEMTYTSAQITAAECVEVLLHDLGDHSFVVLADLPVSRNGADVDTDSIFSSQGITKAELLLSAQNNETLLASCALINDAAKGIPTQIKLVAPIVSDTQDTSETAANTPVLEGLEVYAYTNEDKKINIIVANTTEQPALFLLDADWSLKGVTVNRYSNKGEFIEKIKLGQRNNRIDLLPGQVITAQIPGK